jgi:hypothetical protein
VRVFPVDGGGACIEATYLRRLEDIAFGVVVTGRSATVISGFASPAVERLELISAGSREIVPLSRHRAFLIVFDEAARGSAQLTAHIRDGSVRIHRVDLSAARQAPRQELRAVQLCGGCISESMT